MIKNDACKRRKINIINNITAKKIIDLIDYCIARISRSNYSSIFKLYQINELNNIEKINEKYQKLYFIRILIRIVKIFIVI